MSRAKNWTYTINNFNQDDIERLDNLGTQIGTTVQYLIYGKEVGEEGTPHLQGFVQFVKRLRLSQVKGYLGNRCHVEVSLGTPQQNQVYCQKDEDFYEFGQITTSGMGISNRRGAYAIYLWIDI